MFLDGAGFPEPDEDRRAVRNFGEGQTRQYRRFPVRGYSRIDNPTGWSLSSITVNTIPPYAALEAQAAQN